jgi:hypothetical protein
LSALGAIWGGPGVPRFDSPDPGPRRWAELRARATFALLTAHGQAAEQVSGRFVGEFLGLPEQALLVFKDPEEDMYGAARFKDAVVIALVGQVVPEGADEAASSKIKEDNEVQRQVRASGGSTTDETGAGRVRLAASGVGQDERQLRGQVWRHEPVPVR